MPRSSRPTVLITGAAAGIGRAAAERFLDAGWFVGLFDIQTAGLAELESHWGPERCLASALDVTSVPQWKDTVSRFEQATGGRLDVLFNNAGIAVTRPFADADLERHHRVVDVNFKGVINGCHAAFEALRATPGSRVINMCSASALYGQPELATYSATKAAVRSLTEALDIEWQQHGIRVVDVLPLFVNTAMVTQEVQRMKTVARLGVRLSAQDVAATVFALATGDARRLPTHSTVGWQTRGFALLSKLSPAFLNRKVTAHMAGY